MTISNPPSVGEPLAPPPAVPTPTSTHRLIDGAKRPSLPFYLVVDESESMSNGQLDAFNASLPGVHEMLITDPEIADRAYFGMIGFSDTARVVLKTERSSNLVDLPSFRIQSRTNFGDALRLLREVIERDVTELRGQGFQVYRPVVFFYTDGHHLESHFGPFDADLANLKSSPFVPNIFAFGVGDDVDENSIRRIATVKAYFQKAGDPVHLPDLIGDIIMRITQTVIQTVSGTIHAAATGVAPAPVAAPSIPGMINVDPL